MYEVKRYFPARVWEKGLFGWSSRPATKADTIRRELYLINHMIWMEKQK